MSVTFWMPDAPRIKVTRYAGTEDEYEDDEPVGPFIEFNMSNMNAAAMLDLVYPEWKGEELCGTWRKPELQVVMGNTLRVMADRKALAGAVRPSQKLGPNLYMDGIDKDYVLLRLEQFLTLTELALEHGYDVSFG